MDIALYDDHSFLNEAHKQLLMGVLTMASDYLKIEDTAEMSVTILDNEGIQLVNRTYREKDAPTDVISFAIEDQVEGEFFIDYDSLELPRQLGDIFISFPKAQEQADLYDHSVERELGFLAVHGFLHLNGYDHQTEEEEKIMFDLQDEILEAYGLER